MWPQWPVHINCGLGGLCTISVASVAWHIKCGLGGLFTLSVALVARSLGGLGGLFTIMASLANVPSVAC